MKAGSLFSGVGGFDLGFERAGFSTAFVCEIDKAARSVLRLRFPGAVMLDDVRAVDGSALPAVDVLTFGSPCQDLSAAGKRAGLAGERSGLFYEATRIVRELRARHGKPDVVIWENVPGAFRSNNGDDFAAVLRAFLECGARDVAWRVLDARYFGVPQRRRRVFAAVDFAGRRAEQILFEPESLRGDSAPARSKGRKGARAAACGVASGGPWWTGDDVTDTLDVSMLAKGQMLPEKRRMPCVFMPDDGWRPVVFSADCDDDGICPTCGDDFGDCSCYRPTQDGLEYRDDDGPLLARPEGWQIVGERLRRITPTEAERAQGFPDGWTSSGVDEKGRQKAQADVPRFRQLGNAVAVNVAEWIAERVAAALKTKGAE